VCSLDDTGIDVATEVDRRGVAGIDAELDRSMAWQEEGVSDDSLTIAACTVLQKGAIGRFARRGRTTR
jgi:hypothetical protein